MRKAIVPAALAAMLAGGCGSGTEGPDSTKATTVKHEAACDVAGLAKPKRQTVVVVDEQSLLRAGSSDFRVRNPGVLDALLAVGDPEAAVNLGALAPRERVSLFLAPADGSAPRLMFTGCAPALSPEDRQALEQGSSSFQRNADAFFASGTPQELAKQAAEFKAHLLGAMRNVGKAAPEQPPRRADTFTATALVRSMKAAARLHDPLQGTPRYLIIAPAALKSVPRFADGAAARRAGFEAAKGVSLDLGQAQVSVALAPAEARDFIEAFLLGSRGQVESWSSGAPSNLGPVPVSVRQFSGTIQYAGVQFPLHARLAVNKDGLLTNSWIMVMNEHESATPMSGSAACTASGDCIVTGDGRGFSQLWSAAPGGAPEFAAEMPFSGLRYFEIKVRSGRATGRVYDPLVDQIGDAPGRKELTFEMIEKS